MPARSEVEEFLARWSRRMAAGDVDGVADLFLRDPQPIATFSDGQRSRDWLDVRLRLRDDLTRTAIQRVEVHDVQVETLAADVLAVSFIYDMQVRDVWGMSGGATRFATMTLVRTKDGLRIAAAHFSASR